MAYSEAVAGRVRKALGAQRGLSEKKMFGGIAFLVRGNMCCGVIGDELMVRVGPEAYAAALARPHVREMDFTGKPLKGYVYVEPAGFRSAPSLAAWMKQATGFAGSLPAK